MRFYLPGERLRADRREGAARRGHRAPRRRAAGRAGGVRVELRAARRRRRRAGAVLVEGKPVERGQEPGISFIARDAALPSRRSASRSCAGRDFTDTEAIDRTAGRPDQPDDGEAVVAGRRSDRPALPARRRGRADWFTVIGIVADFRHFQGDSDRADRSRPPTCRTRSTPTLEHRPDDPRRGRSGVDHAGACASRSARPIRRCRCSRSSTMERSAAAQLLAVPAVRLDVLAVRRDRAGAGRRSGSTACCRIRCRSARRRSACGWRSAPRAATC